MKATPELAWAELVGAAMVAGAIVLVLGPLGLIQRLTAWLPAPIVCHRFVEPRLPASLPALVGGVALARGSGPAGPHARTRQRVGYGRRRVAEGPLLLGPLFAFGIALSELSMFGVGWLSWALIAGVAVSALLERDGWAALRHPSTSTR